ncbi:host-nuclease inhibitor Gam family protein [Paucibacter sp. O1-1]|nr:host-nuclease inhibitor Gam family protein [Paucibacter sp. O1-1]MDA3826573.1 host-nuclease inhibitor Gam family protein [Paucibacter sp. O1-1]
MATRLKTKAAVQVPQTKTDCAADIKLIGDMQREFERQRAEMNDKIAEITKQYQPGMEFLQGRLQMLQEGVQAFCEAHREALCGKGKTANLVTGEVSWRQRPQRQHSWRRLGDGDTAAHGSWPLRASHQRAQQGSHAERARGRQGHRWHRHRVGRGGLRHYPLRGCIRGGGVSLSAKQLAAGQRRTLRTMRERLLRMADDWEDLDEYARSCLTDLADKAEEVALAISPDAHEVGL